MSFLMHATSILIIVVSVCNSGHHDGPDTKWQKRATDTRIQQKYMALTSKPTTEQKYEDSYKSRYIYNRFIEYI